MLIMIDIQYILHLQVGIVALNVIGDEVDKDKFIDRSVSYPLMV